MSTRPRVVLLGLMSKMPVAGNVWLVLQYMEGLRRLGYEPYYVEDHGCSPLKFMRHADDDGWTRAASFVAAVMERGGFGDRWAYHALYGNGRCYGMDRSELDELYGSAAAIVNLHGGTEIRSEHRRGAVLIYLGTDPVDVEVHLHNGVQKYVELLEPHDAFFTWGSNYGQPDCGVPVSDRFVLQPTLPVVVPDFWETNGGGARRELFTTVGNWRQGRRDDLCLDGKVFRWSKHYEFLRFLELPRRTSQRFELALSASSMQPGDRRQLDEHGWLVRDALAFSGDPDRYRRYIQGSRAEFTVAKDQNVRLRSGWFSERSAQYLASGRPVITQDTGFGRAVPTGPGLFAFTTLEEILEAVECVNADLETHSVAARRLAREYFAYDVVLPAMLTRVGL